jgi:ribose transport system ATP-binding protein
MRPSRGPRSACYGRNVPLPIPGAVARARGLAFVHQHLGLIPSLSVTENLQPRLARHRAGLGHRLARRAPAAAEVFARFDLALDPRAEVGALSAVQQALLAIVRAYEDLRHATHARRPAGLLVLDEPTPFLPRAGVEQLFDLVRRAKHRRARAIIFVSHDIDEVREITDRATILRDGHLIDTVVTARASHEAFVERIIGRDERLCGAMPRRAPRRRPAIARAGLSGPGLAGRWTSTWRRARSWG